MVRTGDRSRGVRRPGRLDLEARAPGLDPLDGAAGADLDAARAGRALERARDRTHAADRMPPDAGLAEGIAERVVQQQIAAAGIVRAREVPDDRVEAEPAFQQI